MKTSYRKSLRQEIADGEPVSFIGVYDLFSATIAAKHSGALFISGFGFAASYYGAPDIGFIAWSDMVAFVQRVKTMLPTRSLLVDIDDGYGDAEVACHVVSQLESIGAAGVVLEDQQRPRRCGHFEGKQLLDLDEYLVKLRRVLRTRKEMIVIARTDASQEDEITRRVEAFAEAGADAILIDGVRDLSLISRLQKRIKLPFAFNQIGGGKSPACTMTQLREAGVSLVIYSTPCLFAAQIAVEEALKLLQADDGRLRTGEGYGDVKSCTALLQANLSSRDSA